MSSRFPAFPPVQRLPRSLPQISLDSFSISLFLVCLLISGRLLFLRLDSRAIPPCSNFSVPVILRQKFPDFWLVKALGFQLQIWYHTECHVT